MLQWRKEEPPSSLITYLVRGRGRVRVRVRVRMRVRMRVRIRVRVRVRAVEADHALGTATALAARE